MSHGQPHTPGVYALRLQLEVRWRDVQVPRIGSAKHTSLTKLFLKVSARPLWSLASSSHDKDDADSEIKVVLSQVALDEWHYKFEFHTFPMNITAMEFHVLPDDFTDSRILCPGSAICDGVVYSVFWRPVVATPRHRRQLPFTP